LLGCGFTNLLWCSHALFTAAAAAGRLTEKTASAKFLLLLVLLPLQLLLTDFTTYNVPQQVGC
jgi:hypothetical protein